MITKQNWTLSARLAELDIRIARGEKHLAAERDVLLDYERQHGSAWVEDPDSIPYDHLNWNKRDAATEQHLRELAEQMAAAGVE